MPPIQLEVGDVVEDVDHARAKQKTSSAQGRPHHAAVVAQLAGRRSRPRTAADSWSTGGAADSPESGSAVAHQ